MTVKTVVLTTPGNGTWTVPSDFGSLVAIHAIGGGSCGSPGFGGAVEYETNVAFNFRHTVYGSYSAGKGGWYCKATTATVALTPGQILNLHIAAVSAPISAWQTWADKNFGGVPPNCLSDDTWIKDNGGNYIVFAPGSDSSSSRVGSTRVEGGDGGNSGNLFTSGGSGGAGGPAGVPDGQTEDGGLGNGTVPTTVRFFGSGGGSGNLTWSTGAGGRGNRTVAGAGAGSGASKGGDGGNITGNASASSSLLLPWVSGAVPNTDWVTASADALLGGADFTIEWFFQTSMYEFLSPPSTEGTYISVWDIGTNNKSWRVTNDNPVGFGDFVNFYWSTNGSSDSGSAHWTGNSVLNARYTVYGPNPVVWDHIAICRESNLLRVFLDGYPLEVETGPFTYNFTQACADSFFASAAALTFGGTLTSGNLTAATGADNTGPLPGWYGNFRLTKGTALYTCVAGSNTPVGQVFTPPTSPMGGGNLTINWPGAKGATSSSASTGTLTFHGNAQIDSDQYCYPPASPETGLSGTAGADGNIWTDSMTGFTYGPGGGGGGGGGDAARYRMLTGGEGGDGGNYGGGGGQGGGVNSGLFLDLGDGDAQSGIGGQGAQGLIVIEYNANVTGPTTYFRLLGV